MNLKPLALALLLLPGAASACSCMAELDSLGQPMDPFNERTYQAADAVFRGVPVDSATDSLTGRVTWRFAVGEWFKPGTGARRAEGAVVVTEGNTAQCGYPFEAGKPYLVLGEEGQGGNRAYVTGLCSGTTPIDSGDGLTEKARRYRTSGIQGGRSRDEARAQGSEHLLVVGGGGTLQEGPWTFYPTLGGQYLLKRTRRVGFHAEAAAGPRAFGGLAGGVDWWFWDWLRVGAGAALMLPWNDLPGNPILVPLPEVSLGTRWRRGSACLAMGYTANLLYGHRAFAGAGLAFGPAP